MLKKIRWITETAVLLALLLTAQVLTKPFGQLVTGSFVNAILALTALYAGLSSGITVAVISPVMAWLLTIAPNPLTVHYDPAHPEEWFTPLPGEKRTMSIKGDNIHTMMAYLDIHDEPFDVYPIVAN